MTVAPSGCFERLYLSQREPRRAARILAMPARTNSIGRHLPTSGGLVKTLEAASELGLETIQIFVSNPQAWADPGPRKDAAAFIEGSQALGISPVVVHAGSHGGDGEAEGMERLVEGLGRARERAAELDGATAEPVVENSVGAGTQLCSTFESLGVVARRAGVRVCIDTAHAFVAGYDLSAEDGGRVVAAEIVDAVGDAVALVHLNDAKNELGSHRDGHRKVGEGRIPIGAWPAFFDGLVGAPLVMETPYATPEADSDEVLLVKKLAGGLRKAPVGR